MSDGWISVHRKIMSHWLYSDPEKFGAWVQLLLMANHAPAKVLMGATLVDIERGSFITSQRKLMKLWKWSRRKLDGFFSALIRDNMVHIKGTSRWTYISIVNYDTYQRLRSSEEHTEGPVKSTRPITLRAHGGATNNKNNNNNNENKISPPTPLEGEVTPLVQFGKFVRMTQDQYSELVKIFGLELLQQEIPEADVWIEHSNKSSARSYRQARHNHYAFMRVTWLKDKTLKTGRANHPAKPTTLDINRKMFEEIREHDRRKRETGGG